MLLRRFSIWGTFSRLLRRGFPFGVRSRGCCGGDFRLGRVLEAAAAGTFVWGARNVPQTDILGTIAQFCPTMTYLMCPKRDSSSAIPATCATNVNLRQQSSHFAPQSHVFDIDEIMQFTCCFEAVMRFRASRTYTCEKPDYVFLLMGGCNVDCPP